MASGIREWLSKNQYLVSGVAAIAMVGGAIGIVHSTSHSNAVYTVNTFFSSDDGASTFGGEGNQALQMQLRSLPAYRATVYSCDGGSHRFVAYLSRIPDELARKLIDTAARVQKLEDDPSASTAEMGRAQTEQTAEYGAALDATEVKRPGPGNPWVRGNSPAGQDITQHIKCPDGQAGTPNIVLP